MTRQSTTHDASYNMSPGARDSLFGTYVFPAGSYDEMFAAPGVMRPHWETVARSLDALGPQELVRRWEQARRIIHENGVTYNVYGDPQGMDRPWVLDAIPWVIPPQEWSRLEAAMVQRAQLVNALLADVYGPQKLLEQGLLPPELVFAHPGFLRPCHGLQMPNDCYLHFYAADLGRTPDGQWWVLADRAQHPAGAGYALENRLVLSRIFPDLFRDCQVRRLAPFFAALRQTLLDMAPRHRDNPRVVLLTPGPYNETYFEHSYLARYLGYTLVEGGDLTVRDRSVFLKTLAGLQPVDVILRRLDDTFCDPLELNQQSLLGTAGLMQAIRADTVAVVNALGSGWAESAALMPFLPTLCRHVLGEDLALPSVPTWWCGQEDALAYVLDHPEMLALISAMPTHMLEMVSAAQLSRAEHQEFMAKLRARPYAYAAQQRLSLSSLPVWNGTGVQPQQTILRVYAVVTKDGYQVMPGGLTRVSAIEGTPAISMQGDSGSKDTWVTSTGPLEEAFSLLPALGQPIRLRRSGYNFPSRVLDNLFWMGRYAERAEGLVRLLRSMLLRLTNEAGPAGAAALPALLRSMQAMRDVSSHSVSEDDRDVALGAHEQTLLAAMFDPQLAGSVRATLSALHRVSALVRDYTTLECWHIITHLDVDFTPSQPYHSIQLSDALELINHTIMTMSAFSGLGVENMIRGPEWHFLDMGRRLERVLHTASLLRNTLVEVDEHEAVVLQALLEIGDSSITYRTRYLTTLQCAPVLDLLLTDDTNPRAVVYQLVGLAEHVDHLPRDRSMPSLSPAQRLVMTMLTNVRLAEIEALCQIGRNGRRSRLEAMLTRLLDDVPKFSDSITHHYLSHAEPTRHLAASDA
jgi:uncharacterized circularly permuted ATP-grasp superfamily protein/uncharacterized alpha-E superfamily protein